MEPAPGAVQPWTLLVDPAAAQCAIQRISKLDLVRHICRPLDHRQKHAGNGPWARFNPALEAESQNDVLDDVSPNEDMRGIN